MFLLIQIHQKKSNVIDELGEYSVEASNQLKLNTSWSFNVSEKILVSVSEF